MLFSEYNEIMQNKRDFVSILFEVVRVNNTL